MSEELNEESTVKYWNPRSLANEGVSGDLFIGSFEERRETERESKEGRKFISKTLSFRGEDGMLHVLNSTTVADAKLKENGIVKGDNVKVIYNGMHPEKGYHRFDLVKI